jgi:uncharacterized membrane protein
MVTHGLGLVVMGIIVLVFGQLLIHWAEKIQREDKNQTTN